MDILDYLREKDRQIFNFRSVSSVESLVLSQLTYYKFENFEKDQSIGEILSNIDLEDFVKKFNHDDKDREFLELFRDNPSWSKVKLVDCVTLLDKEKEEQFTSMLFQLKDDLYYIGFRGTDGTFTGWKEDFNMSYMASVPSQKSALNFTEKVVGEHEGNFYLGGHSKGGNLSHYAMLFVDDKTAAKIRRADSFDGPGIQLPDLDMKIEDRKAKLLKFLPENSVVGRIYEIDQDYVVTIKSKALVIFDHDPFSWEVEGGKFVLADEQTMFSNFVKETINNFNNRLDDDIKMDFLDFLYDVSRNLDIESVSEANGDFRKSLGIFLKAFRNVSPEKKNDWKKITESLKKASLESKEALKSKKLLEIKRK